MINAFSSWAEQLVIVIIIASIIEIILPENKNKKYIKMVIGVFVMINIISPFINNSDLFAINNLDLEKYVMEEKQVNQESMDIRLQELYVEQLEKTVKTKVEEGGYIVNKCKVDALLYGDKNKQGIKSIELKIKNISDEEKENLIKMLSSYYEIDAEIIKIR